MHTPITLAIVGGGSTAMSFLAQLMAQLSAAEVPRPLRILVFEPAAVVGPGEPYADDLCTNLLNVPAGKMSAYDQDRGHFMRWLETQDSVFLASHGVEEMDASTYLPRPLFGQYLQDLWATLLEQAGVLGIVMAHIPARVERIFRDADHSVRLAATDGVHRADRVVLCNGNLPSLLFQPLHGRPDYFNSPYPVKALVDQISPDASVGVLGTSLSAVDTIVALRSGGHHGSILAISRNGRLPSVRSILSYKVADVPRLEQVMALTEGRGGTLTLDAVYSFLLKRLEAAGVAFDANDVMGYGETPHDMLDHEIQLSSTSPRIWQAVVVSLNEVIEHVWRLLPDHERRRFYSDWRSLWMTRRATFPMTNARKIKQYMDEGTLHIAEGFEGCEPHGDGAGYVIRRREKNGAIAEHHVDYIVNATSFSTNMNDTRDTLMRSLVDNGLACADPFGGVRLDFSTGCLIARNGELTSDISLLGSLAAGTYFWTTSLDVNARLAYDQAARIAAALMDPATACPAPVACAS